MGHHDPQILLGYSKGAIRIYRFRATVYSFKAPRVRSPIDLSEFTEFPGCKYIIEYKFIYSIFLCVDPITHLSCARTYNSLKFIVTFAQEKPENDAKHKDAKSYVKLVEFNGNLRQQLNLFHPPSSTCSVVETQLMPHYEDGVDLTIIYYNKSYTVNVWYLDNKQQLSLKLEKTASEDACVEPLEPAYNTHPDLKAYLLRHPDKIVEFILPHHAVGLKRKATTDFFKESLEAIELQSKKERLLHRSVGGDQKNIFKDKEGLPLSPYDYDEIADISYVDMDEVDMSVMQQKFNSTDLPTEENQTDKASNEQLEDISNSNQIQLDSEELNEEDITVTTTGLNDVEAEVEADLDNRHDTTTNIDVIETAASADFVFSTTKDNSIGNTLDTKTPAITAEQSIGDTKEKAGLKQSNLSAEPENSEDIKTKTKESVQTTQKIVDQETVIKEIDITTEKVEKLEKNAAEIDRDEEIKINTEEIEQAATVEQETIAEPFVLIETASAHDKQEYVESANEVTVLSNQEEQIDEESENIADVEEKVDRMSENSEDDSREALEEEHVNPVNMVTESSNMKDIDQMSEYSEDEQKKEPSNEDYPDPLASTAVPDQSDVDAQDIMSLDRSDTWMEIDPADGNQIEPMDESNSFVILDANEGSPDEDMLSLSDKQDEENEYADVIEAEIEENDQEYEDEKAHDENEEEEDEKEVENEAIFEDEDEDEQADESSESSINESFIQLPEYQEEASEQDEPWKVQEDEEEQEQSEKEKESSDVQSVTSQDLDNSEGDKAENEQEQDFKKSVEDDSASLPEYEETNQFYEAQGENKDETSDIYELADDYEGEYMSYRDSQDFENNDELEGQQEEQLKEDYDEYLDAEGGYDEIDGEKAHVNENNDLISGQPETLSGTANVYPEYDEEDIDYPYEEDEEEFPVDYEYDKTDGYDSLSEKDEYEHSEENAEAQSDTVEIISDDYIEESDTKDNSDIEVVNVIDSDEDELNSSSDSVKDPEIGYANIQSFKPAGEIVVQDKAPASALAKLTALYNMDFYRWGRRKC